MHDSFAWSNVGSNSDRLVGTVDHGVEWVARSYRPLRGCDLSIIIGGLVSIQKVAPERWSAILK